MKIPKAMLWTMLGVIEGILTAVSFMIVSSLAQFLISIFLFAIVLEYIGLKNLIIYELFTDLFQIAIAFLQPELFGAISLLEKSWGISYINSMIFVIVFYFVSSWVALGISVALHEYYVYKGFFKKLGYART